MSLSGGDTIQLSAIEARALNQFRDLRDWLKNALYDWIVEHPAGTQGQAATFINSLTNPHPEYEVNIVDRVTLLSVYIAGAGSWANLKTMCLTYSKHIVNQIAPELGKDAPSISEMHLMQIMGNRGWSLDQVADAVHVEARDPNPGPTFNFITEERWSSVSLGKTVRIPRTNTYDGSRTIVTIGKPEVVSG